jgi:hypothetical protein
MTWIEITEHLPVINLHIVVASIGLVTEYISESGLNRFWI